MHRAAIGIGVLLAMIDPSVAQAGCENLCELSVEPATIDPPLSCASLEAQPQECDCSVLFALRNDCDAGIEAVDFSFGVCIGAGDTEPDCVAVAPGVRASLFLGLSELGRREVSLRLRSSEGEHTVRLASDVKSFDDGGCSISASPVSRRPVTWFSAAIVGACFALRRFGSRRGQRCGAVRTGPNERR